MRRRYLMIVSILSVAILSIIAASAVFGISFTGWLKAFDVTLSPGEQYEHNITVRKFYNVSVRFQKERSTGYLGFTDNDSVVVLKDLSGATVAEFVGVNKGRIYAKMTNYELGSVASVSAYSISDYEDVVGQPVNDTVLSFIGAKAYLTVKVSERLYEHSAVAGYVVDDLTGDFVGGVTVAAFEDGADVATATAVVQNTSDTSGSYELSLELSDSRALDVYVDGYDVV